jgi:hypothetical protein
MYGETTAYFYQHDWSIVDKLLHTDLAFPIEYPNLPATAGMAKELSLSLIRLI